MDWTDGAGVDLAFDTVGSNTFHRTPEAVAVYGDLVTLLQPDVEMNWKTARLRNLRISLELMLTPMFLNLTDARQHQAWILEQCAELFDNGKNFSYNQGSKAHGGFIQEEELRTAHQRTGYRQHLLFTTGESSGNLLGTSF